MEEDQYYTIKKSVLTHIEQLFEEMEEEMATSHQEKYAMLEDVFENATDVDELKVAFVQWYADHADDVEFDQDVDELWGNACTDEEE